MAERINKDKKYTDDSVVDMVRKLGDEFRKSGGAIAGDEKQPVNKYDVATGTYYADEEMAKRKLAQPVIKKDTAIIQRRPQEEKKRTNNIRGFAAPTTPDGNVAWHSRNK